MNKKVLILASSPRKGGNSDTLASEFAKGAAESGSNVETVFLRDKKINYCHGCEYCASHNGVCVQKDDMAEIIKKMIAADVLVFATPVYFYTMDAQMKAMIDRCVARYTEIKNKDVYFIVTAADTDDDMLEKTVEGLRGFTEDCLPGTNEKGIIYGSGVWKKGEVNSTNHMADAYNMGKNI